MSDRSPCQFARLRALALMVKQRRPCDSGRGLVHALPMWILVFGDPLAHAIPSSSQDNGILAMPRSSPAIFALRLPVYRVGPSYGNVGWLV
ncbi:hypothetical protein Nepgr_030126 [Nepenthes gracilis]|uniref:Uncharacterized protein n=1 Tax=Nepenthes gracilis TaxID=150966 RepID=A0AAD3TFT5_NEPGR|nr:hypothetical protein Nepgr_030126 [Nepenthes gracilis]